MSLPKASELEQLRDALHKGVPEPLKHGGHVERLVASVDAAERAIHELSEKRLTIGFLGGTGVGKSTLLNALAGAPISKPGDRRPTTDRAICYRHRDFEIPDWLHAADLADPPPPHELPGLRGVVLIDLPDVDSRARAHQQRVHRILPRLDLLLVVTSVEKYGDEALYAEIREFPQAPRNLVFVLNAIDRLTPEEQAAVRSDFEQKLLRFADVKDPRIHPISALNALRSQAQPDLDLGEFAELTSLLDRLGGDRERQAVLAANARASIDRLQQTFDQELPVDRIEDGIKRLKEAPRTLPGPTPNVLEAVRERLITALTPWISDRALRASWFPIGLMHFVLRLIGKAKRRGRSNDPFLNEADPCGAFTEEALQRPIRLARHQVEAALRAVDDLIVLSIPSEDPSHLAELRSGLATWSEALRKRVSRWGWKIRQHIMPGTVLIAWLGWALSSFVPKPGSDEGWIGSLGRGVIATFQSLNPTTLIVLGVVLLIYYLLIYPYFLYRLEARVERVAEEGSRIYRDAWRACFERAWGTPYGHSLRELRAWWDGIQQQLRRIGGSETKAHGKRLQD